MGEVKHMPLSANHALRLIRETAKDSLKVGIPPDLGFVCPHQEWQHVVTHRQIHRCLEDGEIFDNPSIDEHGNNECWMHRFGGGVEVVIKVVLVNEEKVGWQIYVTEWSIADGLK